MDLLKRFPGTFWLYIALTLVSIPSSANDGSTCRNMSGIFKTDCLQDALKPLEIHMEQELQSALETIAVNDVIPIKERLNWQNQLMTSQATWNLHLQQTCDMRVFKWWGAASGAGPSNDFLQCKLELTRERIRQIRYTYTHYR